MVRITAIAFLAFASSALATPMPQAHTDRDGKMVDFQGNQLSSEKEAQVVQLQQEGEQKWKELEASFSEEQKKKEQEVKDIVAKIYETLGAPKEQIEQA